MIRDDEELRSWMDDWQSAEPDPGASAADPAAILRQVKRRTLGMKLLTAGELILVAGVLFGLTFFAFRHPEPIDIAAMAGLCLLAMGAMAFALWNRRGLWHPAAETTAAYRALSLARARRRREALRAARWLLAAETAIFIPWIWHTLHPAGTWHAGPLQYALAYGYLALVVGVMAALIAWVEWWTRRELAILEDL